jgi:flagellar biosynthetic protein FliR
MNLGQFESLFRDQGLHTNITLIILTTALLVARILPVIIFSPFLGGEVIPSEIKIGIGVTLAILLFPAVADRVHLIPMHPVGFVLVLIKEVFIGLCLSFVVSMVFEATQIAGTVIDTLSGANMAQVMVPQIQQQVTLFSSLQIQLAVVLFLTLNGHHRVIQAFADSLVALPLDALPAFSHGAWPFFDLILRVFGDLLRIGLALAAPAFFSTFLTDLSLGMVNKVAPQIQVYFIAMSIKPMVAVLMVFAVINLVIARMGNEFGRMLNVVQQLVHLLT